MKCKNIYKVTVETKKNHVWTKWSMDVEAFNKKEAREIAIGYYQSDSRLNIMHPFNIEVTRYSDYDVTVGTWYWCKVNK